MADRRFEPGRAVEIIAPRYGSAYRIGGRLVLTAGHLVGDCGSHTKVRKRTSSGEVEWKKDAMVVWRASAADVALVELPDDVEGIEPTVLGQLPANLVAATIRFDMYGWPEWAQTKYQEKPKAAGGRHIRGKIFLADRSPEGFLVLEPDRNLNVPLPSEGKSHWEGISGAAIFCSGILIAIQHSHQRPDRSQSLAAEKISKILDDSKFIELLKNHNIPRDFPEVDVSKFIPFWLESYVESYIPNLCDCLEKQEAIKHYIEVLVRKVPSRKGQTDIKVDTEAFPLSRLVDHPGMQVVLKGVGGAGKTTMLLKLALDFAQRAKEQIGTPVPIYVPLKYFDVKDREFDGLLDIVSRRVKLTQNKIRELWQQETRPCLFLLDGLNEVRKEFQNDCCGAIQQFMDHALHRCIITSRPGDLVNQLVEQSNCLVAEAVQLEPGQIKAFLSTYGETALYHRMDEQLKSLAGNPFMLWAISQSCRDLASRQLPTNTGQLYQKLIDHYVFEVREPSKPRASRPTQYNYELVKKPILANIAIEMCRQGDTYFPEDRESFGKIAAQLREILVARNEEGIEEIEPHTLMPDPPKAKPFVNEVVENGILYRNEGKLEFMHENVRDYFAAVYIKNVYIENKKHAILSNLSQYSNPIWENIFVLCAGLFEAIEEASEFISNTEKASVLLAGRCLLEGSNVDKEIKQSISQNLTNISMSSNNIDKRIKAGDLAGRIDDSYTWENKYEPKMVEIPTTDIDIGMTEEEVDQIYNNIKSNYRDDYTIRKSHFKISINNLILDSFSISKYPITYKQYEKFVEKGGYVTGEYWTEKGLAWLRSKIDLQRDGAKFRPPYWYDNRFNQPTRPVIGITYHEAEAFCTWLTQNSFENGTFRLPTEEEWECAARFCNRGSKHRYIFTWGDSFDATKLNCYDKSYENKTTSPVGIFSQKEDEPADMLGNVWEMCRKTNIESPNVVRRGGSWWDLPHQACIGWKEKPINDDSSYPNVGFRICRTSR